MAGQVNGDWDVVCQARYQAMPTDGVASTIGTVREFLVFVNRK